MYDIHNTQDHLQFHSKQFQSLKIFIPHGSINLGAPTATRRCGSIPGSIMLTCEGSIPSEVVASAAGEVTLIARWYLVSIGAGLGGGDLKSRGEARLPAIDSWVNQICNLTNMFYFFTV